MTDDRPVYVAHDIPDLLNSMPTWFGFRPSESVVAVATSGPRRRFGFRMRADMPAPQHVELVAQTVVAHLTNNGAEGAVLLAVTEHQEVAHRLLDEIERRLGTIVPVVVARADGRRYWVDLPDFPADGVAYETSDHHLSIVQAVAAGQQILPDRQALVDRYAAPPEPRRTWLHRATTAELARVLGRVERLTDLDALVPTAMDEVGPLLSLRRPLTDGEAVRFAAWVGFVPVRDAVWSRITREDAARLHEVFVQVVRAAVPPLEPAVLCLAALAAWRSGNGAEALIAAERAAGADPHYSLANLMLGLLEAGVSPQRWDELHDLRRTA